jgi:hypothetical protein
LIDLYQQATRCADAKRLFKVLLRNHKAEHRSIVTRELRSYPCYPLGSDYGESIHVADQHVNKRE